jgi:hypothetical protein
MVPHAETAQASRGSWINAIKAGPYFCSFADTARHSRPRSRGRTRKASGTGMTATQAIESQDITVGGVFQSFYAVPDYQREYVWTAHVE